MSGMGESRCKRREVLTGSPVATVSLDEASGDRRGSVKRFSQGA